jgi:hypothetical protein
MLFCVAMDSDNNTTTQLKRLVSLIGRGVEVAERFISPTGEDTRTAEQLSDPELRTSIYIIEAACAQLCCLVARPSDILANVSLPSLNLKLSSDFFSKKFLAVSVILLKLLH